MADPHASDLLYLDGLIEQLRKRAEGVNSFWLKAIGKRIRELKKMDPSDAAGIAAIRNDTQLVADIVEMVRKAGEDTVEDARNVLRAAARLSMEASPVAQSMAMEEWINGIAEASAGRLSNLANTSVVGVWTDSGFKAPRDAYIKLIDETAAQMASGTMGLNAAVRHAMKQIADSGLCVVEYESGRTRSLGAALEMNLKEATSQVYQGVQRRIGQEFGANGVQISAHWDCAPDHLDIQGRQFTMDQFEKINSNLERPIGTLNCRHTIYTIIIGVSEPNYSEAELQAMKDASLKKKEFDGKEMTTYEASQVQRRLEREIRKQKNRSVIAAAAGDDEMRREAQMKINQLSDKYKDLSDAFEIKTKAERMQVSGYRPVKVNSLKSVIGVDKDKKPLHPTTDSIQKAESFEELKKLFVKSNPGKGPIPIFDDSIKNYPLEVQKEIAEGLMWTKREFKIKTWPNSVVSAKLPDKVYGDYTKRLQEIRLRENLTLEDAFTTAVHEMIHHSQYITDVDCDIIIAEAAKAAGYDRRENTFRLAARNIAGKEYTRPEELIAYSVSESSVGINRNLANAIYKAYRKKVR